MDQSIINIIIGIAGCLGGFVLHALWDAQKDLQKADTELAKRVGEIEVLVAGNYVTRDDFKQTIGALFDKLDRISDKIDGKQDRVHP